MTIRSGISKKYNREFMLDEDSLRRLHGILDKASKEINEPTEIVLHVEREDDRFYETKNIDDVLSDPNVERKKVDYISIELRPTKEPVQVEGNYTTGWSITEWIVQIGFYIQKPSIFVEKLTGSYRDSVFLRIASDNRNWALLLSDELEPQLQRTFKVKSVPKIFLWLFVIPFIVLAVKPALYRLKMGSVNHLGGWSIGILVVLLITWGMILLALIATPNKKPVWLKRIFGPESAFFWGEEAKEYLSRENTRQQILWTVIVGFIISLLSSIVVAVVIA